MNGTVATQTSDVFSNLGFEELSKGVSFYKNTAPKTSDGNDSTDPTLIILCSWAFAQPKHIAKYIVPYQGLYPAASILLVRNVVSNAIWRPDAWQLSFFEPAVTKIQQHVSLMRRPRILVHTFSNGGSHAAVQMSQISREVCGGLRMPVDALILDSAPGIPRFGPTIRALQLGSPSRNPLVKAAATLLAYGTTGMTAVLDILNVSEPAAWKLYRILNDPDDVFLRKGEDVIPRAYIYSKTDEMIMEEDVLGHGQTAKRKLAGLGVEQGRIDDCVRLEEFVGTAHVNHVKGDSDRYWNIVRETWRKVLTSSG